MKDYKRHVLWLDYFNSSLSREQGRRISLDRSVKDPKIDELLEATRRLGYKGEIENVKHPKRMWLTSGYVSVEKRPQLKKGKVISEVSKILANVRGEKAASVTHAKSQKQGPRHQKQ